MKFIHSKFTVISLLLLSLLCYFILGYQFQRDQFDLLLLLYSLVFASFVYFMKLKLVSNDLFKLGLLFRIVFLFSTPILSQDFYRFIWDGHAVLSEINPFTNKPDTIINSIANFPNASFLYQKMGSLSASHYSNYPPINQLFFVVSAFIGGKSILLSTVVMRSIIILADVGIYYYARKILTHFNKNSDSVFWYFLNPLVILELTGNLHFEGVMLFFFVGGLYYIIQNKWILGAVFIAISIATKLLPLLLLPLFLKHFGWKKSIGFYVIIIVTNGLLFMPFVSSQLIENYSQTISLWFTNFEFNASIYYIARAIGFYIKGYNTIHIIGQYTPFIIIAVVLFFTFFKKNSTIENLIANSLLVVTIYFFISTTVHPWYLINLVLLSVFTKFRYAIVWSYLIILSYFAYAVVPFQESKLFLFLEYGCVFLIFLFEIRKKTTLTSLNFKE